MSNLRIAISTALAVIVIVCLFVGVDLAFAVAMTATGYYLETPWMAEVSVLWLILAFWVLPKDWMAINRAYACRGNAFVAAPIEQVWDAVQLRPRTDNFRPVVSKITADLIHMDRYHYHLDPRMRSQSETHPNHVTVQVTDAHKHSYLRLEYPSASTLTGLTKDIVSSEIFLEPRPGGVEVTFVENLHRLSIPTLFSLMFINPSKDAAMRLKSWIEGTPDQSRLGRFMDQIGADGDLSKNAQRGVMVAGVTGFVMLSAIAFGIISFVVFALPDS